MSLKDKLNEEEIKFFLNILLKIKHSYVIGRFEKDFEPYFTRKQKLDYIVAQSSGYNAAKILNKNLNITDEEAKYILRKSNYSDHVRYALFKMKSLSLEYRLSLMNKKFYLDAFRYVNINGKQIHTDNKKFALRLIPKDMHKEFIKKYDELAIIKEIIT